MQRNHSILAQAAIVGLGLLVLLGVAAQSQAFAAPPVAKPAQDVKPGEYWIGVAVQHPVPDQVRAQLPIPKDEGILVEGVGASAPADGKLQLFDVIVKAGDKTLKSPSDLVSAVDAVKGGKLPLEILRGGKTLQIEVTPVKRPPQGPGDLASTIVRGNADTDYQAIGEALKRLDRQGSPLRFFAMHPGWMVRPGGPLTIPLPANLTITVTRQGDKPATIVVKRDDRTWEITENEMGKLPIDIWPHVDRMLGRRQDWVALDSLTKVAPPSPPKTVLQPRLDKQLDEIRQQLDQLRKTLDELRAQQAAPKAEKK